MSNTNVAAESARPSNIVSEIDRLVGGTLPGANLRVNGDGTTEALAMPENAMSRNADVAPPPDLDDLLGQIEGQGKRITQLDEQLNAQVYDRSTGQSLGHRISGKDREQLIAQRERAVNEQAYIAHLIQSTSEARIAWNQARAAQAASNSPAAPTMEDAANREAAINELAEMPGDGPGGKVGRLAAIREYDAAQLRARADKLARGR